MKHRILVLAVLSLVPTFTPAQTASGSPAKAPITPIHAEINLLLDLHNHLMVASRGPENALPEYSLQVTAYRQAREMAKDPVVWQIVNDACVEDKGIAGLARTAAALPPTLHTADREATLKLLSALQAAWPRYEATEMVAHNRSLQQVLTKTLRKHFNGGPADRVLVALQEEMILKPLGAPVTIYPVIRAAEAGAWGMTTKGYYIVVPVRARPSLILIENIVHELTHLLELNQVQPTLSMPARLRQKAAGSDPEIVESFLHGLIAWNAGEMVKRFLSPGHKAVVDIAPDQLRKIEPYLPIYKGAWVDYLDGKVSVDQTVESMVTAFRKVPVTKPKPEPGL